MGLRASIHVREARGALAAAVTVAAAQSRRAQRSVARGRDRDETEVDALFRFGEDVQESDSSDDEGAYGLQFDRKFSGFSGVSSDFGNETSGASLGDTYLQSSGYESDAGFFYDPTLGSFEVLNGSGAIVARGELEDVYSLLLDPSVRRQDASLRRNGTAANESAIGEWSKDAVVNGDWLDLELDDGELDDSEEDTFNPLEFEEDDAEKFIGEIWAASFGESGYVDDDDHEGSSDFESEEYAYVESAVESDGSGFEYDSMEDDRDELGAPAKSSSSEKLVLLDIASDMDFEDSSDESNETESPIFMWNETELRSSTDGGDVSVDVFVGDEGELLVKLSKECAERCRAMSMSLNYVKAQIGHTERRIAALEDSSRARHSSHRKLAGRSEANALTLDAERQLEVLERERSFLVTEMIRYERIMDEDRAALEAMKQIFTLIHK